MYDNSHLFLAYMYICNVGNLKKMAPKRDIRVKNKCSHTSLIFNILWLHMLCGIGQVEGVGLFHGTKLSAPAPSAREVIDGDPASLARDCRMGLARHTIYACN